MTDINAAIAIHRGWRYGLNPFASINKTQKVWYLLVDDINQCKFQDDCPDFQGDARLYMALFEEMADPHICKSHGRLWLCVPDNTADLGHYFSCEHAELGTAICLAYMRLHGLE